MNDFSKVETLFQVIDQTALILRKELDCSYLEAIAETGENLFHGDVLQDELDEVTVRRLKKEYDKISLDRTESELIRKGYQLAILKGMKEAIQPNHQMTPDTVGMFMSYLVGKFMHNHSTYTVLDPVIGTGNLLTTVLNGQNKVEQAYGVDVDELLIKLAYVSANLQKHPIQFFNQDSLQPLFIDPVDLVVADLPVGYYPNDEGAKEYRLKADEGHSYAHHLLIEQSLNYVKEGGYVMALVPNNLFESEEAPKLHEFLKEETVIQGLIQLPLSIFKQESHAKSIFILQKKGADVEAPKQALLVDLPKFTNKEAMGKMMGEIDQWFAVNKR